MLGMPTFGASAPAKVVQEYFGYSADHIVHAAKDQLDLAH
jgi:transketolase